jgi:hypothetical protein
VIVVLPDVLKMSFQPPENTVPVLFESLAILIIASKRGMDFSGRVDPFNVDLDHGGIVRGYRASRNVKA